MGYSPYYRDLKAAARFGLTEDAWWELPYDSRVTIVAMYEIDWRVDALQRWEQKPKTKPK